MKLIRWINNIFKKEEAGSLYVEIDPSDNCITLSEELFRSLKVRKKAKVIGLKVGDEYAFSINPKRLTEYDTILSEIQYNTKYNTFGYHASCPTVARIIHEYGLPFEVHRLKVEKMKVKKMKLYVIKNELCNQIEAV